MIPLLAAAALLTACAAETPPPDTARAQPGYFGGNGDPDTTAANLAQWAFAMPSRTAGDPADGARAVASVDYLAGELSTSPRWGNISPITKDMMLQARTQTRNAIGVAPGASSQAVVSSLARAGNALAANNTGAAIAALSTPTFLQPGAETLQRLGSLPYIQVANVATQRAATEMQNNGQCYNCD